MLFLGLISPCCEDIKHSLIDWFYHSLKSKLPQMEDSSAGLSFALLSESITNIYIYAHCPHSWKTSDLHLSHIRGHAWMGTMCSVALLSITRAAMLCADINRSNQPSILSFGFNFVCMLTLVLCWSHTMTTDGRWGGGGGGQPRKIIAVCEKNKGFNRKLELWNIFPGMQEMSGWG